LAFNGRKERGAAEGRFRVTEGGHIRTLLSRKSFVSLENSPTLKWGTEREGGEGAHQLIIVLLGA